MQGIDRYAYDNRWSRHHPGERLLLAFGLLFLAVWQQPAAAPLAGLAAILAALLGAGVPLSAYLKVVAAPAGFLLAGTPLLALSVEWSEGLRLAFSPEGARVAAEAALRSLSAVCCLALLALTVPVTEMVAPLRRMGVPAAVVELVLLIHRLVFVLAERALAGHRAQAARLGQSGVRRSLRSAALLGSGLLGRAYVKAERMELGLAARGFSGDLGTLRQPRRFSAKRLGAIVLLLFGLLLAGLTMPELPSWPT
ncbi:cobalt ECF transporter T component CbiQ [Telmatospirillum sp. J64-1]|uniref:cobalt ECF transporter T component CbiQ n=1 Tax=Telmatospirillum sp. J64-1 TaxID=2502183 RepID=UPI00115D243D|nr:cobalt ECF transporter T component CbiQ [Telmatospirillum sp. J64-1]